MHIAHIVSSLEVAWGGPARVALELSGALARRGHTVELVAPADGGELFDSSAARAAGVRVNTFPIERPRFIKRSSPLRRHLLDILPQLDIVHLHSIYLHPTWLISRYAPQHSVPYIFAPHGALDPFVVHYRRYWLKRLLGVLYHDAMVKNSAAVHFTSEEERRDASPLIFNRPTFILPNGLDFTPFDKLPPRGLFRAKHPSLQNSRILLYLGRVNYKKGIDVLIQAFAQLAPLHQNLRLVIAGPVEADMRDKLATWLRESGQAERILLTGMVSGSDKYELLVDSDLFVLSSLTENFGIAILEALAAGLPVIISDKVNICNEIAAGDVGVVAPVDAQAFAAAIAQMLDDPERMQASSARARAFVRRNYDWEAIAERLEGIYMQICNARGRSLRNIRSAPTEGVVTGMNLSG